jgi:hypothetical protein
MNQKFTRFIAKLNQKDLTAIAYGGRKGKSVITHPQTVTACSCGGQPTGLESFDEADEVVIGRALSVESRENTDAHTDVDGVRSATRIVEKVFKGKLKVRDEIVFGKSGGADASGPSMRNQLVISSSSI